MRSKPVLYLYALDQEEPDSDGHIPEPIPYIAHLMGKIWDKRYVVFCPDMKTARRLYDFHPIGTCCVNLDGTLPVNRENLHSFNTCNHDHLLLAGKFSTDVRLLDVEAMVFMHVLPSDLGIIRYLSRIIKSECPKMYFFAYRYDAIAFYAMNEVVNTVPHEKVIPFHFTRDILKQQEK